MGTCHKAPFTKGLVQLAKNPLLRGVFGPCATLQEVQGGRSPHGRAEKLFLLIDGHPGRPAGKQILSSAIDSVPAEQNACVMAGKDVSRKLPAWSE